MRSKSVKPKRKSNSAKPLKKGKAKTFAARLSVSTLLTSALDSVNEGIVVMDKFGRFVFQNQTFRSLWSIPPQLTKKKDNQAAIKYLADQLTDVENFLTRAQELSVYQKQENLEELQLKDGRTFAWSTKAHYRGEKMAGWIWSFRDVTDEVSHGKILIDLKNRYELVVASFGRVVYDYEITTGKIIWSGNTESVLGYQPQEMGDINDWLGLVHVEDRQKAYDALTQAQNSMSKYEVVYRCRTKAGDYVWIRDSGFFIANQQNQAHRMVGEMEDITREVQTEKEIRHLALFPFHYPEVILEIKNDGSLSYGNPAFYETIRRLGLPDHTAFVPPEAGVQFRKEKAWKTTTELQVKGRTFSLKIFYLPEKELVRIYAFDLTERLESEKQKSDLELTYKTLFEGANDSILIISLDSESGKIVSANTAAAQMYGYTLPELLDLSIQNLDVITEVAPLSFEERLHRIFQYGRQVFEVFHRRKDGSVFPVEFVVNILEVSEKKYLMAIGRDISARKNAEEEIRLQYRFIESLAAASPDIVYVYDIDSDRYVYANQNMANSYGYPVERLMEEGHKLMVLSLDQDDVIQIPGWIEQVKNARDNEVVETQFRLRTPDGIWRTFHCRESAFLRDNQGCVKQIIGSAHDITDKVVAENALRESEERFRTLHEAILTAIAIHDNGVIVECNKGLSELSGYTYSELIGMNGVNLAHPDDRQNVIDKIKSGDEKPYDIRGLRKDGTIIELEIHGKSIPYKGMMLSITEFRDITERKKAAEKILEQNARLQAITDDLKFKNEQLDEFTQIVSHNLRSPAGNIVSLTKFLQDPNYSVDQQEILGLLKDSGDIILNTLAELNEVLKIKQNKNIERQELHFENTLSKVKNMLNVHIADTGAIIQSDFAVDSVFYPNIYLESIMLNLLSNALKYRHPARLPHIKFATRQHDGSVILEVSDNGLGINLERYGHLVFKLRKTFHQHPDSRGIGLFMIKNQIESMGGKIGVQSAEAVGSTFVITF